MFGFTQAATPNVFAGRAPRWRRSWWRVARWGALGFVLVVGGYLLLVWPWISRWGATNEEAELALLGDDLVATPVLVTTKAVTIDAAPEAIWPWLVQLGVDRGGMYSYLWVENWLMRLNVENSDVIHPEWQSLQAGDFIRFTPKEYALNPGPGVAVMVLEPMQALAGCFAMEDKPVDCDASSTWQFVLMAQEDGTTRLLLRSRTAGQPSLLNSLGGKLVNVLVFYMERKMLLGIKARGEQGDE